MNKTIIHMSDLHFRQNWDEDQGVVLDGFFQDLNKQLQPLDRSSVYIVFSGDFVLKGGDPELFNRFFIQFDTQLNELGIPNKQRICVPGNHDISQDDILKNLVNHEAIVAQKLNEASFNDYISDKTNNVLLKKFENYKMFEAKFAEMGVFGNTGSGAGWNIDNNVGVYCLNTALCSSGGVRKDGKELSDLGRLAVDTRNLQIWSLSCKAKTKILVMHHPVEWFTEWARAEIRKILHKDFAICLSGHIHDQDVLYSISNNSTLVECSAPPLLTNKHDHLGYSLITIAPDHGVIDIRYRQWTKYRSFVSGVNFSNTDDGIVQIRKDTAKSGDFDAHYSKAIHDFLSRHFEKKLDDALRSFSAQPIIWVEPILNRDPDISLASKPELNVGPNVNLTEFIENPKSTIIKAPPQFGLTCLSHYLCKEAWNSQHAYWIYLDAGILKPDHIEKTVKAELQTLGCSITDIKCIILDSWTNVEKKSSLLLEKLCARYSNIPIIVMQTIDDVQHLFKGIVSHNFGRNFETLYLWPLPRASIRKIVTDYNKERYVGDIDTVLTKVVSDLEVLNLPRTPLNCLTLLKVSEVDFDENPVNRTELIDRILFVLFNMDNFPTFKSRPDLKDCEYVLGFFCEIMLRNNTFAFTRQFFFDKLEVFCKEKVIDLDVQVVFDILYQNNILVERDGLFSFRFSYWIFYFAAQRMHHDANFASYILKDIKYASFPEIIEFYTGIDRRREDALNVLFEDMKSVIATVEEKLGLPKSLNPFRFVEWKPSPESFERVQSELVDSVKESNLPDTIKDQYADRTYDPSRPYNQEIQTILQDHALANLIEVTTASARALRNSDYANPEVKRKLLDLILQSTEEISKIITILAPILASKQDITFEGTRIKLMDDFGDTTEKKITSILLNIPANIIVMFQHDLFSRKMGALLIDRLNDENSDLIKHNLILLLISQKPRGWKDEVQNYIMNNSKNSFYLLDTYRALLGEYRYSFASHKTIEDIKYLVKMIIVKHNFGVKEPSPKAINKISDKSLPPRTAD